MKIIYSLFLFLSINLFSQEIYDLEYYFGEDYKNFNESIPKPSDFLLNGKEVGSSHVSHDRLIQYMYALANASKRIDIENRGFSYEGRPLVLLTITSEENHDQLLKFKRSHIDYLDGKSNNKSSNFYSRQVVIYQGYSIHGNEPSGSNNRVY